MSASSPPTFYIRDIPIYGNLILAPMDGYSDQPFRRMARKLGSALSYTEFINALDVIHKQPRSLTERIAYTPDERPIVYQLLDNDPQRLLTAAQRLLPHQPDIIDINLGCSARSVSGRGAGAGLLKTPQKIAAIFDLLSKNLPIPITGKIRLGWDENTRNYQLIARIIEENGGQLIAVHGRTRAQQYSGHADWDAIAEIKQSVSIPVIANGDVQTVADIDQILAHTHCNGVMIGRAATTNPWIFSRLDRHQVSSTQVRQTLIEHLNANLQFYGPERGLILFRKYATRYIQPHLSEPLEPQLRLKLLTCTDPQTFLDLITQMI
jgi:nifR3 family TIM-barrel protein